MKKELGGQEDLFDAVLASAVPNKKVSTSSTAVVAPNAAVNGASVEITKFYTYDELRVLTEDLPEDVDTSMKEVQTQKILLLNLCHRPILLNSNVSKKYSSLIPLCARQKSGKAKKLALPMLQFLCEY